MSRPAGLLPPQPHFCNTGLGGALANVCCRGHLSRSHDRCTPSLLHAPTPSHFNMPPQLGAASWPSWVWLVPGVQPSSRATHPTQTTCSHLRAAFVTRDVGAWAGAPTEATHSSTTKTYTGRGANAQLPLAPPAWLALCPTDAACRLLGCRPPLPHRHPQRSTGG